MATQPAQQRLVTEAALDTLMGSLTYDSGDLDITALLQGAGGAGIASGAVILSRIGHDVWLNFQALTVTEPSASFALWNGVIQEGFRPKTISVDLQLQGRASGDSAGPIRVTNSGQLTVFKPAGTIRGLVHWYTRDAAPVSPSGVQV